MEQLKRNYADLILQRGVSIEKGQILVVDCNVTTIDFLRILVERAYELGAADVVINFADQQLTKTRLKYASIETLQDVPQWWIDSQIFYGEKNACFLRLYDNDPDGLNGVDGEKLSVWKKAIAEPLFDLNFKKKENLVKWSASVIPGKEWAQKIFPEDTTEVAMEKLWKDIFDACYVTKESGTDGWDQHIEEMSVNVKKLNDLNLRELWMKNSTGTDLKITICDGGVFAGGICHCPEPDGVMFAPNIPTEEILTTPHRFKINGTVHNSIPLCYSGNIVDQFTLTLKDGVVVDYHAQVGEEILKGILETDEGSSRLGEVALVPFNSPINQMGHIFYDTLLDENASCHLALGAGYTDVIRGEDRSKEALEAQGLNTSSVHVDFMFGTADMECIGVTEDGTLVQVFKDGAFNL